MGEANAILVVEDDDGIRRLLLEYFRQHEEWRVDGARDGVEALHRLAVGRYSAIVLDVMMPKMSGVDFLDSLMAMCEDPSVKALDDPPSVVVITATAADDLPTHTLQQKFPRLVRAVFRKPLDVGELGRCVEDLV